MKISVLIPVLNGGKDFRRCLVGVCSQDIDVHEYVIVDNNSTDNTKALIEEFQKTRPNMHYVFEPVRTRGAARNAGVAKVSGDIIVMTDADCVVPTDWVRKLSAPIVGGRDPVVGGGQYDLVNNYWSRHMQKMGDHFMETAVSPDGYVVFCDTKNFAIDARLMKSMMFDARFKALENVEFDYRMRPIYRVRYLSDVKVGHRNVGSLRSVLKLSYERAYWMSQIYHKFKDIYDKNGVLIFPVIPAQYFYFDLLKINFRAITEQGIGHLAFFIAFDVASKLGSAVGFARIDERLRVKGSSNSPYNF